MGDLVSLNAGCGNHQPEGWLNVDCDERYAPDLLADCRDLSLIDGCASRVYASHVLEHVDYSTGVPAMLAEFARILIPGGELAIVGPDIDRAVILGEPIGILQQIVAWPAEFNPDGQWPERVPPAGHAWTVTTPLMEAALDAAGWKDRECYSGRLGQLAQDGWPVENRAYWQNAWLCRRT